jgi:hypothetical protein
VTPFITLELFSDDDAQTATGVEGFPTMEAAADFTLRGFADRLHPGWRSLRADMHNDVREVLAMLDTIEATARFLVGLEYPDDDVRAALAQQFPGQDPEPALVDAHEHKTRLESEVEGVEDTQAAAARASELDLSKSIHDQR